MAETLVIKVGGGLGVDVESVCADIAALVQEGHRVVVVHGTSAAVDTLSGRVGVPARTLQSPSGHVSRYTDAATLEVYMMAAVGQVNPAIVGRLQTLGVNALGLNGLDGRLLGAQRKDAVRAIDPETGRQRIVRDDYTGRVETVNGALLTMLLDAGYTPIVAPLAMGAECEPLNVDGDRAAAQVAGVLRADTLVILTNVVGLMAKFPDEASLIRHIPASGVERAIEIAGGRMKKKVLAAQEALHTGVRRIVLADSRRMSPIRAALAGEGTVINRD
ncbi:MAG TPA: [LysW]-aminoadipate kinase [Aggregatilineales bacterium]|nr:[LysW]-aminoadipate kinase [Anaerolineales bacterium]HRE46429.1 [LysW]-aminoadipate kinase [Aggregatilineales bacterium]